MPRVSIVMPAHDSAATIGAALASVQEQSFTDWELVVCDDASSDDTAERVKAWDDPRIRLVTLQANLGPAGARNEALCWATGELVAFLDADDWWTPSYLDRQVGRYDAEAATPGPPVGIVACDALLAREDGTLQDGTYLELFGRRRLEPVTVDRLLRRDTIFISCLVPRVAGEEVGWFDESLFGTEDHDLWLKIVETGRRVVLQREPLAVYRRTAGSISRVTSRQALNNQRTLHAALARGRLTARQRRVAHAELRYNRALEAVAGAAFERRPPAVAALPAVAWVAVSRPGHWAEWLAALRPARRRSS